MGLPSRDGSGHDYFKRNGGRNRVKRGVWVHQFNQQSEQTAADYAAALLPRDIDTVYAKAMDGGTWMGEIYSHPLAPYNMASWVTSVLAFKEVGLRPLPWVVNRSVADEAWAHIECGRAAGGMVVDFEFHYAGFWMASEAEAKAYFDVLRLAIGEGLWVAVAPDPRQVGRDYDSDTIAGLSAYLPQTYWTDFQRTALNVLGDAQERCGALGPVEPIFPYNSTSEDMQAALEWSQSLGCQAVSLWRMGSANAQQLDAFARKVAGEEDEPDVTDEERAQMQATIDDLQNKINGLVVTVADIADRLGDELVAETHRTSVRKTTVRSIVKQMQDERVQAVGPRP